MEELLLEAIKYDCELLRHSSLKVHSIFANSINLIGKGEELVYLGSGKNGLPPGGIILENEDFKKVKENLKISDEFLLKRDILYKDNIRLFLKSGSYSSRLRVNTLAGLNRDRIKNIYEEIINMKLINGFNIPLNKAFTWSGYELFFNIFNFKNEEDLDNSLRKLMGRGIGLTPSGDDMLVGLLWVDGNVKFLDSLVIEKLSSILSEDEKVSTDISLSYYRYALENRYNSSLLDLGEGFYEDRDIGKIIRRIADYGHTSGVDLLTGILYGLGEVIK